MSMTVSDARERWCPFATARVLSYRNQRGGRDLIVTQVGDEPVTTQCVASRCMAWRWIDAGCVEGFCGLAGAPR